MTQKILKKIYSVIWRKYLLDGLTGEYCTVIKVRSFRGALIETPFGQRQGIYICKKSENDRFN